MCLAVPGKIVKMEPSGQGVVEYVGSRVEVNFSLIPAAKVGDWVIVHAGFAISSLDKEEAGKTLELFREMEAAER